MSAASDALDACSTVRKRARIHDAQVVTKMPKAMKTLISDFAKGRDWSDADVVRDALAEYFERRGYGK